MKTIVKSVLVHSCELQPSVQPELSLVVGQKYVLVSQDPEDFVGITPTGEIKTKNPVPLGDDRSYFILNSKCSCRQLIAVDLLEVLFDIGGAKAIWQLNPKKNQLELYQVEVPLFEEKVVDDKKVHIKLGTKLLTHIWRQQQVKVPRIDLISAADIERAYLEDPKSSTARRYKRYIEEIHEFYMRNRFNLFAPEVASELHKLYKSGITKKEDVEAQANAVKSAGYREDPTGGRILFPFSPDERTQGGH